MSNDLCFLCGLSGADTTEHVIPRNLYVPPRPSDLLTAPSHDACNKSTSRDEEWLGHTWSLSRPFPGMNQARWDRSVRALRRDESARMRDVFLASFSELPSGGAVGHIDLPRIRNVLAKIVKGLLFKQEELLIGGEHTWAIRSLDLALMVEQPFTHQVQVHDVVVFRWETLGTTVFWALAMFNMQIYWGAAVAPVDLDRLAARVPFPASGVRLPWPRPET